MPKTRSLTPRMISDFCRLRLKTVLDSDEIEVMTKYLVGLIELMAYPPYRGSKADWVMLADATGIEANKLKAAGPRLQPVLDAVARSIAMEGHAVPPPSTPIATKPTSTGDNQRSKARSRPGPAPKPIIEHPEPLFTEWEDPAGFGDALNLHMRRHGDTVRHLYLALDSRGEAQDQRTLMKWCTGQLLPMTARSFVVLNNIERRYRLPLGYFKAKLPHQARAIRGVTLAGLPTAERRRLAWHLPDDFLTRPKAEQEEILEWVRRVIISGSTDYRQFQAAAMRQRYAVRFTAFQNSPRRAAPKPEDEVSDLDEELQSAVMDAPAALDAEMNALLRFKTATLTAFGFQRNGVWNEETASQKVEHLGLMFGALASGPRSTVKGAGVPLDSLCFAMLIFPAVWDWYLQWREQRRGFYTKWEVDMLSVVLSMSRAETGWIRQTPSLADRLRPIPGMITDADIDSARSDWEAACELFHKHARHRIREIERVARVHRDPFEPILPILESASPVGEYRKITEEIMRLMPDERRYPRQAAEAVRSFLLLRLGMHTGLRQRNLRELLVCPRGRMPTSERHLEDRKRGELRWSDRDQGWEVLIPSVAFKNSTSSFFGSKPFRLVLPDLAGLYDAIEAYIDRHRARLLGNAADPGTFFVKTCKRTSADASYNQNSFYEAWRLSIQRYGIYNPWTGRGAIKGLLPHGPHNIRDVLATHILKQTGSFEQASYAIQDTPDMVAKHYGRFLPQDKSAIAAKILNQVWEAA
ncbi:hypothetical protein SAMN06295905_3216 [Devosia lucknowensis]|uniref:Uncharacterized protein n=2 Tax=Devosia lucknowensis TaxID=1096929 RepID=A0A1Y6G6X6_9HYPH|nr:hypothetical protein SAMN06295905_3216 [Devosia lucknowensis]